MHGRVTRDRRRAGRIKSSAPAPLSAQLSSASSSASSSTVSRAMSNGRAAASYAQCVSIDQLVVFIDGGRTQTRSRLPRGRSRASRLDTKGARPALSTQRVEAEHGAYRARGGRSARPGGRCGRSPTSPKVCLVLRRRSAARAAAASGLRPGRRCLAEAFASARSMATVSSAVDRWVRQAYW